MLSFSFLERKKAELISKRISHAKGKWENSIKASSFLLFSRCTLTHSYVRTYIHTGNRHLTVFNDQMSVQIGGLWNANHEKSDRAFVGVLAGVIYNGLRPLDQAASSKLSKRKKKKKASSHEEGRADVLGDVRLLEAIPFDFRDKKPELFTKEAMDSMMKKVFPEQNSGKSSFIALFYSTY